MALHSDGGAAKARKVVESALKAVGLDPAEVAIEAGGGGYAWHMRRGSADVILALNSGSRDAAARLRIVAPILRLADGDNSSLFTRLLELNATEMPGIAFGVQGAKVVIVAERTVIGLDRAELDELLTLVGHFADEYDDRLADEFGVRRVCDGD